MAAQEEVSCKDSESGLEKGMNQNSLLLDYLEHHSEGITQLEAFNTLGICRLSERARELQANGIDIKHTPVTVPTRNGKTAHVMRYTLSNQFAIG